MSGLSDFLLSLVVDGGAIVGLARKGVGALRALLGGVSGRLGALLKRALAFAASKLGPVASAARAKIGGALASLRRRAEAVLRGEATEPEAEPSSSSTTAAASPSSSSCAASPFSSSCAASPSSSSTTAAASVAIAGVDDGAPGASLSTLAPLLGRALVRVLQRPRGMRSGRASPFVLGAT